MRRSRFSTPWQRSSSRSSCSTAFPHRKCNGQIQNLSRAATRLTRIVYSEIWLATWRQSGRLWRNGAGIWRMGPVSKTILENALALSWCRASLNPASGGCAKPRNDQWSWCGFDHHGYPLDTCSSRQCARAIPNPPLGIKSLLFRRGDLGEISRPASLWGVGCVQHWVVESGHVVGRC